MSLNLTKCNDASKGLHVNADAQILAIVSSQEELNTIASYVPSGIGFVIPINGYSPSSCPSNIRVLASMLVKLAVPDKSIDLIVCSYNINELLEKKEIDAEFSRILKPTGTINQCEKNTCHGKKSCGNDKE